MEGLTDELRTDYQYLVKYCNTEKPSDEEVFKIISSYDIKYKNNNFHYENAEGLLSNIGIDLRSIPILNAAISRLNKKNIKNKDKYNFDLGNTYLSKADIEYGNNSSDISYLVNSDCYIKAKKHFLMVTPNDITHFQRAITNLTNILERYGRNYEAIYSYNKVLKLYPKFGMALGNKAIALKYYLKLSPHKSFVIYQHIFELLEKALQDPQLKEIGGVNAIAFFNKSKDQTFKFLKENKYKHKDIEISFKFSKYQRFIMKEDLFLNYDFGIYYDEMSLKDNFFPNLIEKTNDIKSKASNFISERTFYTFKMFNTLVEDFITSRHLFYTNRAIAKSDKNINYIYLHDYSIHSCFHGNLKHIFANLYNCLDKIAHIVKYYFFDEKIDIEEKLYFDWLRSADFKKIITEQKNYQLLALYNLALDFCTGYSYTDLRIIRNKITHSFLIIKDIVLDNEEDTNILSEEDLIKNVKELFMIVKSALFYVVTSINFYKKDNELYLKMEAIMEHDIYNDIESDANY